MFCAVSYLIENGSRPKWGDFRIRTEVLVIAVPAQLSVDGRSGESYGSSIASRQVEGEVVSVTFVHDFHTQVGTVDDVRPGGYATTGCIYNRLVEVETVQVERHRA